MLSTQGTLSYIGYCQCKSHNMVHGSMCVCVCVCVCACACLSTGSHCLWCPVTSQTHSLVSAQVGCDHLNMHFVQHHNHPASVGHKLWHNGQRDRELVNSSLHPPHSGQLCRLWAVHGQSLDGLPHKPAGSSLCHSEGRLAGMTLALCRKQATQNTFEGWRLVDRLDITCEDVAA